MRSSRLWHLWLFLLIFSMFFTPSWAGSMVDKGKTVNVPLQGGADTHHAFVTPSLAYIRQTLSVPEKVDFLRSFDERIYAVSVGTLGGTLRIWQALPADDSESSSRWSPVATISLDFSPTAFEVSNGVLYVGDEQGVLHIMTINASAMAVELARYQARAGIRHISFLRNALYLTLSNDYLLVLDGENPEYLHEKEGVALERKVKGLSVSERGAFYFHKARLFFSMFDGKEEKMAAFLSLNVGQKINDLALFGDFLYLAHKQGVTVYRLDEKRLFWHSSYGNIGAIKRIVFVEDRLIAIAESDAMYAFEHVNKTHLEVVSMMKSLRGGQFISSKYGLIVADDRAIHTVDVSKIMPGYSNEVLDQGQGVNYGGQRKIFIDGDTMYVADWFSGVHIYDISMPSLPKIISTLHTPGSSKGIVVENGMAYIADDDHGLQVADVRDLRKPKIVAHLPLKGLAYTPVIAGDKLYMASHRGGIQIVDIAEPEHPTLLGEYNTPGMAWSLKVKGDTVFVADDEAGLLSLDVKNPTAIRLLDQWQPGGRIEDVLIEGDRAYVAIFDGGVSYIDISDPYHMIEIFNAALPGNARGLDRVGDWLFVASWKAGVYVLDSRTGKVLFHQDTPGAAWGVKVKNGYVYVADWWAGMITLRIMENSALTMVDQFSRRDKVFDLAHQGRFLYAAQGISGVQVFEASNAMNPTWVSGFDSGHVLHHIALKDSVVYGLSVRGDVLIYDAKNPFAIYLYKTISLNALSKRMILSRDRLLVSTDLGASVYDVSTPLDPIKVIDMPVSMMDVSFSEGALAVLESAYSVRVWNTLAMNNGSTVKKISFESPVKKIALHGPVLWALMENGSMKKVALDEAMARTSYAGTRRISHDFLVSDQALYLLGGNGVTVYALASDGAERAENRIEEKAFFPVLSPVTHILKTEDVVFLSGGSSPIAIEMDYFEVKISAGKDRRAVIQIPKTAPEGEYDLIELPQSKDLQPLVQHSVFRVRKQRFSKPKMTMKQFQRLLKQHKEKTSLTLP